jgi:hypothetical protein
LSLQKLHSEEKRRNEALSSVQEMCAQLETCKGDLIKAEKHRGDARALAVVYKTKADALKKQLSEEKEKVQDLQRDRRDRDEREQQPDSNLQRDTDLQQVRDLQPDRDKRECYDLHRDRDNLQLEHSNLHGDHRNLQQERGNLGTPHAKSCSCGE